MILTQTWVGYLDRSYEQIKKSCLARLGVTNPEITDYSESNILIIIISMIAGIAEMLNLYIDNMARECFIGVARKYDSVVRTANLMDYQPKARSRASVVITFTLNTSAGVDITIPALTVVSNGNGAFFRTLSDIIIPAGILTIKGNAAQYTPVSSFTLASSNGYPNQSYLLSANIVHKSISMLIDGDIWTEYTSFGLMTPTTKGFLVIVREDHNAYLTFGDGLNNGAIPGLGLDIDISYQDCLGKSGNLPPNTIKVLDSILTLPTGITLLVNNEDYATGGDNFEGIEEVRNRAPRYLRTLERAVTPQDYTDLAILVPGVKDAITRFCCGKYVDLYIIPTGRGTANQILLDAVEEYMNKRKMITTFVHYYASGISKIWVQGLIYLKPLVKRIDGQLQVADALDKVYGYDAAKLNRKIVISEIIATIENLSLVDRFELAAVKILPFARRIEDTTTILGITFLTLPMGSNYNKYTIVWNTDHFDIYLNDAFVISKNPAQTYIDDTTSFTLLAGSYVNGDKWELTAFASYPAIFPSSLIEINDLSEAVIDVAPYVDAVTERNIYGDITFVEQALNLDSSPIC